MHHSTCFTHVPWCISGSLTRSYRENFPDIPRNVTYIVRGIAAEIRSPGRQMRPMNQRGDPRSYHRWSVWRPMDSLGFAEKCFGTKLERRFHRCTDIKCPLCLSKVLTPFGPFWPFLIGCMVSADYWLADYPELRQTTQPSTIGGPLG